MLFYHLVFYGHKSPIKEIDENQENIDEHADAASSEPVVTQDTMVAKESEW